MKNLLLLLLMAATEALAHPEFISDVIDDERQMAARPPEQRQLGDRYAIRGTFYFGSPVHEELTIRALERSGILGRAFRAQEDAAYIRGVFWNDDPTALLWPDPKTAKPGSWGVSWYAAFSKAKKQATAPGAPLLGPGDSLLGRSHFGDLQFLHGMANADGIAAEVTHAKVMMWAEFVYRVAVGEIAGTTHLSAVPVVGIPQLFEGDASLRKQTVEKLFGSRDLRKVAAGSLLHLIQDSFADGHVDRVKTNREVEGLLRFGRGEVRSFNSYINQDEKAHAKDDQIPVSLAQSGVGTGDDPIEHGAVMLRMMFSEKGPGGRTGVTWAVARAYLEQKVFRLPEANRKVLSGPGNYERKADITPRDLASGSDRVALLVGIGEYKSSAITRLRGPVNDVARIKKVLVSKYGFREQNILVLTNQKATRKAVLDAFDKHLIARAGTDAAAVFYFSGHGSQMTDYNLDEVDDGLDETLVVYDSRTRDAGGAMISDIIDDEINEKLAALSKKTKNILAILDSCHSGTGIRAIETGTARFIPPPKEHAKPKFADGNHGAGSRGTVRDNDNFDYVLVTGSRSDELSYEDMTPEGVVMGSMTYELVKALEASRESKLTYRALGEEIRTRVSAVRPTQHPQLEGRVDRVFLGLEEVVPQPYFAARLGSSGTELILDGGLVHGITVGSTYSLHIPGSTVFDASNEVGVAKVSEVRAYASIAQLGTPVRVQGVLRAVERERAGADYFLPVAVSASSKGAGADRVRGLVKAMDGIKLVGEDGSPRLVVNVTQGRLEVRGAEGQRRGSVLEFSDQNLKVLQARIAHYRRWNRVLDIDNEAAGPEVQFTLTRTELNHGEQAIATLRNNSGRKLYFAVLDLAQDGAVEPVKLLNPNIYSVSLDKGGELKVPITFTVPAGYQCYFDVLKLFVTDDSVDFSGLSMDAARKIGDQSHPLEKLLAEGVKNRQASSNPVESWGTRRVPVKVSAAGAKCF